MLDLVAAAEFQPTEESRAALEDRALAARVRATLKASPATAGADLDIRASAGRLYLQGIVSSGEEQEAAARIAGEVAGVTDVAGELRVFRRPVR